MGTPNRMSEPDSRIATNDLAELQLPQIQLGPISCGIGSVQCVLRPAETQRVTSVGETRISPRLKEKLYTLENGQRIVVTARRKLARPSEADGVLYRTTANDAAWLNHRLIDELLATAQTRGWRQVTRELANEWNGRFSFRSERPNADGSISSGNEGLRPPQLGALHAIGAHWSLYTHPATIVMPTGTGKTETMLSALAAYVRGPMLVVVPSDVLRSQTARKFLTLGLLRKLCVLNSDAPNPIVGIVTKRPRSVADLEIFDRCNVIVGTMSSLGEGDASDLVPEIAKRVEVLVVDEAHHVGAAGWTEFREKFSAQRILQFTATPFRRDGKLVDGAVIYNYPLRMAQKDGYFKKIAFEPVYDINSDNADRSIAATAIERLRADVQRGLNHLVMARCSNIDRATAVHQIYRQLAPDLRPILVHSDMSDAKDRIAELRAGDSRVVVCVNMLGEGFDLPELKIAAVHDLHKSLAVLLQFTGRFTRSAGDRIGDATVVANIADANVSSALERLYSEDADWNQVLSELSSDAAREHSELVAFLSASQRLDSREEDDNTPISQQILRPTLGTLFYRASEFKPKKFYEGLPSELEVYRVWLHSPSNTLFFVTRRAPPVKWTRSKAVRDLEWALFVLHYDEQRGLLYLSSSDHSSSFDDLAQAVGGTEMISGDVIFRSLGRINRLIFQNVGVKKHGRRNLRYAMYTGADVANALSISEQAGSVKSNLSGTGWEDGRPTTIGCSYKGRVWTREQGPIPRFVKWCETVGDKLVDDTIDTSKIIANVLIPEEVNTLPPGQVLLIEWPVELLHQSEERVVLARNGVEQNIAFFDLNYLSSDAARNSIDFALNEAETGSWGTFAIIVGGAEGFKVVQKSGDPVSIKVGNIRAPLEGYLSDYPPLIRFVDLTELDGNLLIKPQDIRDLVIGDERFEAWSWDGVDITKESTWKDGLERTDSIQSRAAQHFITGGFEVVFDDDSAGEAADLVCLKEEADHIKLALVHCKYSGGAAAGERVKDVVEVSSQAVRSAKWKWKFRELCKHLHVRESRLTGGGRVSRFIAGRAADLSRLVKVSRFKEVRTEILIVQPGLSKASRTGDQSAVLAAASAFLKETVAVDLDIICAA
jgi:superfamily II DNA or RNA helicase